MQIEISDLAWSFLRTRSCVEDEDYATWAAEITDALLFAAIDDAKKSNLDPEKAVRHLVQMVEEIAEEWITAVNSPTK